MKNKILLSCIPWIIFSAGFMNMLNSAIIAFLLNIFIGRKDLLRGGALEIGGFLFFLGIILVAFLGSNENAFLQYANLWSNFAMSAIMLSSVVINKPFTKQEAQHGEHRLHLHLSSIWGVLLLLAAIVSLARAYYQFGETVDTASTIIAIFLGIKANTLYPKWFYRRRVRSCVN